MAGPTISDWAWRVAAGALLIGIVALQRHAAAEGETFRRLSAAEIRSEIVGSTVTDDAHWWDYFLTDGALRMIEDGKETKGRWNIDDDRLCFTFPMRGRTVTECFEIWRSNDLVDYRQDGIHVVEGMLREQVDK